MPRLNRIPIEIRANVRAGLSQDADRRAPLARLDAAGTLVTVRGQWQEDQRSRQRLQHSGDEPQSDGYFIVRARDLDRLSTAGTPIAKGDEIVSKAGVDLVPRLYVIEVRDQGHVSAAGRGTLRFVYFSARRPNR